MPKSGSSWLDMVVGNGLAKDFGFCQDWLLSGGDYREQEFCVASLDAAEARGGQTYFMHQHCGFSDFAAQQCLGRNGKVILQVRRISDCLTSLVDHWRNESVVGPMAYLRPENLAGLTYQKQLTLAADLIAPWYFRFWSGWQDALQGRVEGFADRVLLVRYEDLHADPEAEFLRVAQFCEPSVTEEGVAEWIQKTKKGAWSHKALARTMRKNRAVVNRGQTLDPAIRSRLDEYAAHYRTTDFSTIGI